uniref:Uncharacterized protein n=1 Tax=Anguilla anguilla TaxID=7936 RepID=A0A0E9WQ13_ANGAN
MRRHAILRPFHKQTRLLCFGWTRETLPAFKRRDIAHTVCHLILESSCQQMCFFLNQFSSGNGCCYLPHGFLHIQVICTPCNPRKRNGAFSLREDGHQPKSEVDPSRP